MGDNTEPERPIGMGFRVEGKEPEGLCVSFRAHTTIPWEDLGEFLVDNYLEVSEADQ